jgi:beta-glucosidase
MLGKMRSESYLNKDLSPRERALDLIPRMTLREKAGQLSARLFGFSVYERRGEDFILQKECLDEISRYGGLGVLYGLFRADPWSGKNWANGIPLELATRVHNTVQRKVLEHSRFGIPALMATECPHGHQALGGYLLPVNLGAGATFYPDLHREAFRVCGTQLKSLGIHLALLSTLDVLRDPRWGRSEECYSEDPVLSAALAEAAVAGCVSAGVEVIAKHLGGQGETTGGINGSSARIGPREFREIHLPPVWGAMTGGASGFMAAYNNIDGIPCHANSELLKDILRGGGDILVMSDGNAVDNLDEITGSPAASAALALKSGVDIGLWGKAFSCLEEAVEQGFVSESVLDEAVTRVLTCKFRCGAFDNPFIDEKKPAGYFTVDKFPQSLELARHGAVLLKNDKTLPLDRNQNVSIAVIGPDAADIYSQIGDYSAEQRPEDYVTLWDGLRKTAGIGVNLRFAGGSGVLKGSDEELKEAAVLAKDSDIVILVIGGSSSRFGKVRFENNGAVLPDGEVEMDCGEGVDCASLELPLCQRRLYNAVFDTGKPVIAVVNCGRPYVISDLAEKARALIVSFYPGPWGGLALAEILFGGSEPAGRLPVSIPRSAATLPVFYNKRESFKKKYIDTESSPLFSFGAGLSYTTFAYTGFKVEWEQDLPAVSFTISNTGGRKGWAVPMLFIRWVRGTLIPRTKELKQFTKVLLEPGESKFIRLRLSEKDLCRWNHEMKYRCDTGAIRLMLEEGSNRLWESENLDIPHVL